MATLYLTEQGILGALKGRIPLKFQDIKSWMGKLSAGASITLRKMSPSTQTGVKSYVISCENGGAV